jgi:hypothetical protein
MTNTGRRLPPVLEVRRMFEPSRLSSAWLATAYAQVVPQHQRRAGGAYPLVALAAEPSRERAARTRAGIRDV